MTELFKSTLRFVVPSNGNLEFWREVKIPTFPERDALRTKTSASKIRIRFPVTACQCLLHFIRTVN